MTGIGIIRIDIIRIHIPMDTRHFDQEESSMIYQHIKTGTFISRPNRFIAHVRLEGQTVVCHVKNTGRREVTHGDSRFDLAFTLNEMNGSRTRPAFMEVKGVTLETDGMAMFPDAPTERGIKHLHGLAKSVLEGYEAYVLFVIQMKGVHGFRPNDTTHPAFGDALRAAAAAGVHVLAYDCAITPAAMTIDAPVDVILE